jgi:hypothetical protein
MPKPSVGKFRQSPADYRIPVTIAREIGRIMVAWASFEYSVQSLVWRLAGVSEMVGRLAVREPRIGDRLALFRDLAELRGIVVDEEFFRHLNIAAAALSLRRDLLAHSIWGRDGATWRAQNTRGKYSHDVSERHDQSRRIAPESIHADAESLRSVYAELEKLIKAIRQFSNALPAELPPLRDKRPSLSQKQRLARSQIRKKPPAQP